MADEPSSTPPPTPPAVPPGAPPPVPRPPVPGWMWMTFGLGPMALGMLCGATGTLSDPRRLPEVVIGSGIVGLVCAPVLLGGLALASRFFGGTAGRVVGGLMFAAALTVGLGAVAFAGCMCLLQQGSVK